MTETLIASSKTAEKILDHSQIQNELIFRDKLYPYSRISFLNIVKFISDLSVSFKNVLIYFFHFKNLIDENFLKIDEFFKSFVKHVLKKFQEPTKTSYQYDLEIELAALNAKINEQKMLADSFQKLIDFISFQIPDGINRKATATQKELANGFSLLELNLLLNTYLQRVHGSLQNFIDTHNLSPNISESELKEIQSSYHKYIDEQSTVIDKQMGFMAQVERERYIFLENLATFCYDMKTNIEEKCRLLKRVQVQFKACVDRRKAFFGDLEYLISRDNKYIFASYTSRNEANIRYAVFKDSIRDREQKRAEIKVQEVNEMVLGRTREVFSARGTRPQSDYMSTFRTVETQPRQNKSPQTRGSDDKKLDAVTIEYPSKSPRKIHTIRRPSSKKPKTVTEFDDDPFRYTTTLSTFPDFAMKTARSSSNYDKNNLMRDSKGYKIRTMSIKGLPKDDEPEFLKTQETSRRQYSAAPNSARQRTDIDIQKGVPNSARRTDYEMQKGVLTTTSTITSPRTQKGEIYETIGADLKELQKKVQDLVQTKFSTINTRAQELSKINMDKIDRLDLIKKYSQEMLEIYEPLRKLLEEIAEEIAKCSELKQLALKIEVDIVPNLVKLENFREKIKGHFYNSSADLKRSLPGHIKRIEQLLDTMLKSTGSDKLKPLLADAINFYLVLKDRLAKCSEKLHNRLFEAKKFVLQSYQEDFKKLVFLHKDYSRFLQNNRNSSKYFETEEAKNLISENADFRSKIKSIAATLNTYRTEHFQFEIPRILPCMEFIQKIITISEKFDLTMHLVIETNHRFLKSNYENLTTFRLKEYLLSLEEFVEKKYQDLDTEIGSAHLTNEDVREIMKQIALVINRIKHFLSQAMIFEVSITELFNTHLEKVSQTINHEFETAQYTVTMLQSKVEKLANDFMYDSFKNQPVKTHPVFSLFQQIFSSIFAGDQASINQLVSDLNLINMCHGLWNRSFKKFKTLDKFIQGLAYAMDTQEELNRSMGMIQSRDTDFRSNYDEKYLRAVMEEKALVLMKEKLRQIVNSIKLLQGLFSYNQSFSQKVVEYHLVDFSQIEDSYAFFKDQWEKYKVADPEFEIENDLRKLIKEVNDYIELFLAVIKGIIDDFNELKERILELAKMEDVEEEIRHVHYEINNFIAYCKERISRLTQTCDSYFCISLKRCVYEHNERLMHFLLQTERDFRRFFDIESKLSLNMKTAQHGDPEIEKLILISHDIVVNFEENYMKIPLLHAAFAEKAHVMTEKILNYQLRYTQPEIEWALKVVNVNSISSKDQERFRYLQGLALLLIKEINTGKFESLGTKVKSKELYQLYSDFLSLLERVSMLTSKHVGPQVEASNLEYRRRLGKLKDMVSEIPVLMKSNLPFKKKKKKFAELLVRIQKECEQGHGDGDVEVLFSTLSWKYEQCFTNIGVILDVEAKSEEESAEIYEFILGVLEQDIYLGNLETIRDYQERSKATIYQFEQSTFAEVNLAWLDLFYHTHVLIDWCQERIQHEDTQAESFLKELNEALQEAENAIEMVTAWETHQEIQKNIVLFYKRKEILISIKHVMDICRKLIQLEIEVKDLPHLYNLDKKLEEILRDMDQDLREVLISIDFLDRFTARSTGFSFREIFFTMKLRFESVRMKFYEKRLTFGDKNSLDRSLFLIQKNIHYLLNQILILFKGQQQISVQYSLLLSHIFTERNTEFTLRIVKFREIDYSKFVIHAYAQFNPPDIAKEITLRLGLSKRYFL